MLQLEHIDDLENDGDLGGEPGDAVGWVYKDKKGTTDCALVGID